MSSNETRRRFSDSQVPRSNLLPELEAGGHSSLADRGAFETIGRQLELEEKLHILSQQLLQSYKETQQWACVGQLAQGLIASSQRVGQLKQQLESLREKSGGLFLESIRERSLPREDDHALTAADQSLVEEDDTSEVGAIDAEDSSRIPVEQDTPDSCERTVQPSVDHREIANSLSEAADLLPVPTTSPTEAKERPQEAGVKSTEQRETLDSKPATESVVGSDSLPGASEEREESFPTVESLEQPSTAIAELGKDNINSTVTISPPGVVRGDTPPFEDASSNNLLVGVSTTADRVETAEDKSEVESASDRLEREAIVPLSEGESLSPTITTLQAAAAPVEQNSSCQQAERESVSELDCDGAELENDKKTALGAVPAAKSESPPPTSSLPLTVGEFEPTASSDLQQSTAEGETLLNIESEGGDPDHSTPPTVVIHTEANEVTSDHQQSIEQGDTTPLTTESLGETHGNLGDSGLGPTKSASSIDREFGLVDQCLDELTSEIEALVIASDLSSETSDQFFSPPESITVEVEYVDSLQLEPKSLKEIAKTAAAVIDQVVLPLKIKVEEDSEREKSPGSTSDSGEVVKETTDAFDTKETGDTFDTELDFEKEREDSSEKENSPGLTSETEEDQLTNSPETEPKEVSVGAKAEESGEREESPEITFESGKELEAKEATLEEQEETSDTIDSEPQNTDLAPPEQTETSDTADSPKDIELPPPEQKETSDTVDSEPEDIDLTPPEQRETSDTVDSEPKDIDPTAPEEKETSDTADSELKDIDLTPPEQKETSDTADFELKDVNLSPPVPENNEPAEQFAKEEINPTIESDITITEAAAASTAADDQDILTEQHTQESDKMEPKLAIRYSVKKSVSSAFSANNKLGTTLYCIDTVSDENGHTCTQSSVASKPVERYLEDFIELHQKLLLLEWLPNGGESEARGVPQLDLKVCKLDSSTHENGAFSDKEGEGEGLVADHECKILEAFLNQIANNPHLQNEPIVTNFLSPTPSKAVSSTMASEDENTSSLSPLTNGVKEPEPSFEDIFGDGRVASEDESLTKQEPSKTFQPNGADQVISEHQLNQSAQSGEDDLYKLDQVDRSDQPTDIEDSAPVTNAEDTTVATSQATPPVDLLEARAKVVSTTDQFGEEAELCLLPEKTQDPFDVGDGGDDLDDLRDPGDLSKEFPTKEKEKPETLPPREEEDTSNELSIKEGEGKEEDNLRAAIDNLASHAETAESGLEQASPKKEEEEATHQVAGSEETSPNATVQGGLAEEAPVSGTIVSNDSNVESNVKSDEEQNVEPEKLEGSVPTDAAVSSGSPLVSPTHKEASPNVKDEEKEREASLSPFHSKSLSFGKEMMIKPSLSPAVASLNGDESDLSPTHSERTSSNATTSSYLYTTDESLSPQKTVRPVPPLQRTSSSPTRESENKLTDCMLEERDSFHMSLMPSQAQPISPEGSVEVEPSPDAKSRKKVKRIGSMPGKIRSSIGSVKRTFTTKKEAKKRSSSTLTRTNTVDDEAINNVSVLKPLTTQEWDPTCLLEELYSDYKQGLATAANPSGESARHYGYLDKLPTNRTKANLTTKWKRRYFRAQEGNIYYYQDRRAEKALGFIHLQSSRVVPIPEKLQIQIIPKDGKSIMLKAPDMDEFQAWHRALLLEATHPTLIAPSSPKPALENPIIVIDVGACSVRAGLVRDDPYPEIFFPAVCSFDAETFDLIECGLPALLPDNRYKAHQVYPRKVSLRMDRKRSEVNLPLKAMDAIVSTIMMQLDIDPQVAQLIMTLPPTVPEQERDELVELLLGTFGFAGICLQDQTQLALFSYNTTTGIIVDIGNHITVIPYIDGYAIEAGITRLPFGGNAITENLAKLVTMKGMRYFSETEMFINRFIKESLCFISQNYEDDLAECDKDPKAFLRGVDVDRFQLPDHRKMVTLDSSLFKAPEGLFSPHLWGKDVLGLHEIVWKAIQACPIDQRRELSKNIFLSGGSSVIPGLKERLRKEVASMAPAGVAVEVHTRGSYHHAAYCGASVLASLGSFQNYLVSWDDWSTTGAEALRKWTGS